MQQPASIPRPLVRANQAVIVACVAASWLTGRHALLVIPLAAGLFGVLLGYNPVMRIARLFLRKPLTAYVPEDADAQRFNQIIAVFLLAGGWAAYAVRMEAVADVLTAAVGTAAFAAMLGFCCGCFLRYQWRQYRYRNTRT